MQALRLFTILITTLLYAACGGGAGSPLGGEPMYTAFTNPEIISVTGYSGDIMEPFISREVTGTYLFFNDNGPLNEKEIHFATKVDDTTFQYVGPINTINTSAVDGVPSMDNAFRFFYISTANYNPPSYYDTVYSGSWNGSTVNGSAPVSGLAITTPGFINFDIEVSPDGATLYFNDGDFTGGNSFPDAANIAIAVDTGSGFVRDPNSASLLANVNTHDLEYAPAISADGMELFFTRLRLSDFNTKIYRATRSSLTEPFGIPQHVIAISGFVEGPAFSPDEKSLYYHRRNPATGTFELYRVTRP